MEISAVGQPTADSPTIPPGPAIETIAKGLRAHDRGRSTKQLKGPYRLVSSCKNPYVILPYAIFFYTLLIQCLLNPLK